MVTLSVSPIETVFGSDEEEEGVRIEIGLMNDAHEGYEAKSSRIERTTVSGAEMRMLVSITRDSGWEGFDMVTLLSK